jgi:hypothetical protein
VVPRVHPIQRISQETNSLVIPIAVSDAAFLYSVIAMSSQMIHAMHCSRSSGLGSPQTSKEMPGSLLPYHLYKLKAIQLLNPKLDNSSDALQLSTIYAVTSLLHIEVRHNLAQAWKAQLQSGSTADYNLSPEYNWEYSRNSNSH